MQTPPAIRIDNLVKEYASPGPGEPPKLALKGVSFDVPQGGIFGLLGPNGAGKSTLINILAGLVRKTGGNAEIWGFDTDDNPRNAKRSIGIVPQEIVFDPFFTPFEVLENQAGFYGIPKAERRSEELLKAVHLWDKRDAYARTLSGGMKRRLLIAKAMVHSPPILVLDEPTAGVDVELRRQLWELVTELNREGVTVVLTTHYLEEAEAMCDTIAIINHGRLIACETTPTLLSRLDAKEMLITVDAEVDAVPPSLRTFNTEIAGERQLRVAYPPSMVNSGQVFSAITDAGLGIVDVSTRETDLEEVFLKLTQAPEDAA